jgi:hypothetical protein
MGRSGPRHQRKKQTKHKDKKLHHTYPFLGIIARAADMKPDLGFPVKNFE